MKAVSPWEKGEVDMAYIDDEAEVGKEILGKLDSIKAEERVFLVGNHEEWLPKYLESPAARPFRKSPKYQLNGLLDLKNRYKIIPFNDILQLGDANFTHGIYTNKYHAKKTLEAVGGNIYYSHIHEVQSYAATTLKGIKEGMSCGCLRTLNAPFLRNKPTSWAHAFFMGEFLPNGSYTRYVPIIIDGKFSFGGRVYYG